MRANAPVVVLMVALATLVLVLLLSTPAEATGTGDYPPPGSGVWLITDPTVVWDEVLEVDEGIQVAPGGSLMLSNMTLLSNGTNPGAVTITVEGALLLDGATISAANGSAPYLLSVLPGGVLDSNGSILSGFGFIGTDAQRGLLLQSNATTFSQTVLQDCYTGITIEGVSVDLSGVTVRRCTFGLYAFEDADVQVHDINWSDNVRDVTFFEATGQLDNVTFVRTLSSAIDIRAGEATITQLQLLNSSAIAVRAREEALVVIAQSTILPQSDGIQLEFAPVVVLQDVVVADNDLRFVRGGGTIEEFFSLTVDVRRLSDGAAVAGADLQVIGSGGQVLVVATTNLSGRIGPVLLHTRTLTEAQTVTLGPHTIVVQYGVLLEQNQTQVGRPTVLTVWVDDLAPRVVFLSPQQGALLNDTNVTILGAAWDDHNPIALVQLAIDDGPWQDLGADPNPVLDRLLGEGVHRLALRAFDVPGNNNTTAINITIDTTAPVLVISDPPDNLVTRDSTLVLRGRTEPNVTLTINGTVIPLSDGTFAAPITLREGQNRFDLRVVDLAGNGAALRWTLFRDTVVSPLLLSPPNGSLTNQIRFNLTGTIEANSTVEVDGQAVRVLGGRFLAVLLLVEGPNNLTLNATDALGNEVHLNLTYILDATPPEIHLTKPAQGIAAATNRPTFGIAGWTEPGAVVYVNDQLASSFDGRFSRVVGLLDGANNVTVVAADGAGNSNSTVVVITLDTTPPVLNVTTPSDGSVTTAGMTTLKGHANENVTLRINGNDVLVRADGTFTSLASLAFSTNRFELVATDAAGNSVVVEVAVRRVPPHQDDWQWLVVPLFVASLCAVAALAIIPMARSGALEPLTRLGGRVIHGGGGPTEPREATTAQSADSPPLRAHAVRPARGRMPPPR